MNSQDENIKKPFSFVDTEQTILDYWDQNNTFKQSLDKNREKKPYIFYDGPPFATGLPHHGHLVGSILKDIVPRYFTMKGFYVERRFGWDCHGLPIEHEIDKKLEMSTQEAVKQLGIAGYNNECRGIVQRYTSEWEKTIKRIGRWVDFENDYKTMDLSFMESVWWVFKQLWDKNLVYKGNKVVPFSSSLGTVLSNFEAGLNYQDVQDPSVSVLFKLKEENSYLMAWTTTPWTLPSNLGLCVGADINYVKIKDEEKNINIIIAKDRISAYEKKRSYTILDEFKGSTLKGKLYLPLFNYFKEYETKGAFQVFNDDYVTTDNGTGIVHLAPSFGEDDNRVFREAKINLSACPIDDSGKFTNEVTDYQGIYVKDADKHIIKKLKEENLLYDQSVIVHSYPFCYRSDTPLLYRAIPSWYVNVEAIKDKLIKSNQEINWIPSHIKEGRFGKWLEGARDWAISRNRVWGTPLPIWQNDINKKIICIGSVQELKKYTGTTLTDLHREFVDDLTFTIENEEGTYKRITEVFDCWFESGSMPYAQLHYPFENKDVFDQGFPAEFIAEGLDQTRGWFYTLTILSTALFEKPAFKNVIVNGIVMAEDGKKMSKRLKNYTAPDQLMETYGADALRLYLITSGLVKAEEQRFSDAGVKDMVRRALLPWYNSFKFFQTYAQVDGWNPLDHFVQSDNITDHWVISNLQTLKMNVIKEMELYKLYNVVPSLFTFIEDLTNWYIRLNRSRFWGEGLEKDKCAAYSTLYTVLYELCQVMAPFAPFLSEHIFQEVNKFGQEQTTSVHLTSFPAPKEELTNTVLEDAVDRMQQIILLGRQKRNQTQIKVKTPLSKLTIIHKDKNILEEISKLQNYIKSELNVKEIIYSEDEDQFITLYAKPNSPVLGKKLGKDFGKFRKIIEQLHAKDLKNLELTNHIEIDGRSFELSDLIIFREAKEGTQAISNKFISIDLDCNLTPELLMEGLAREIVNRIQKTRKEINLNVDDRILIKYKGDDHIQEVIEKYKDYISTETLTLSLEKADLSDKSFEYKIENYHLGLEITTQ